MKNKKLLSLVMAMVMAISLLPILSFNASAEEGAENDVTFTAVDGTAGSVTSENCTNLFDGKNSSSSFSKWCVNPHTSDTYVVIKASKKVALEGYTFITGNDTYSHQGRNPKAWELYGSNDYDENTKSGTWTLISSVADGEMPVENFASKYFDVNCSTGYIYFRFVIKEIVSTYKNTFFQLCGMEFSVVPNISLGKAAISGYDSTNGYKHVYYGTYNNEDIKWRVLDMAYKYDKNDSNNAGVLLLSENALDTMEFGENSTWNGSTAQAWCNDMYNSSFGTGDGTKEKDFILGSTSTDEVLSNDRLFFLSKDEANKTEYFPSTTERITFFSGKAVWWWLRSPDSGGNSSIYSVSESGSINAGDVSRNSPAARPAFNLNSASVLFTSAAKDGKRTDNVGQVSVNTAYDSDEYKLTMKDDTREFDVVEENIFLAPGGSIDINYSDANVGDNEYISAMIEKDGKVLYYGQLEKATAARGEVNFTLPSDIAYGTYDLHIFNEQINGDYKTDFSSDFKTVTLMVSEFNGAGTKEDPYIISKLEDLETLRNNVNSGNTYVGKYIKLANDISMSPKYGSGAQHWNPIGTYHGDVSETDFDIAIANTYKFEGTFDGAGHTISGYYTYMADKNKNGYFSGMFGCIGSSGTVKNVICSGKLFAKKYGGSIAAVNYGTISGCANHVESLLAGNDNVGGICAVNFGKIEKCKSENVYIYSYIVGGIAARNEAGGEINNCTNDIQMFGKTVLGGIAGENKGTIKNCFAYEKRVQFESGTKLGRVVGINSGTITNCFYAGLDPIGQDNGYSDVHVAVRGDGAAAYRLQAAQSAVDGVVPQVWGENATLGYPYLTDNENDKVYKISYMAKDGSGYKLVYTGYATNALGAINMPSLPDTEEVKFRYWSLTPDEKGTLLDSNVTFTKDMEVYAVGSEKVTGTGMENEIELEQGETVNISLKDYVQAISGDESTDYTFSISTGYLPRGLSLNDGKITGTVQGYGTYEVTFGVTTNKISLMSLRSVSDGDKLTLTFKIAKVNMNFDKNGGDTPAKRHYSESLNSYDFPWVNPTREGYYFAGWYTKDGTNGDWGNEYTESDFDRKLMYRNVYAKWERYLYPIADMFDIISDNSDTSIPYGQRISVEPKGEYKDEFTVDSIKYIDYYTGNENDTLASGEYEVRADITAIDSGYRFTDIYVGSIYVSEQDNNVSDRNKGSILKYSLYGFEKMNNELGEMDMHFVPYVGQYTVIKSLSGNEYTSRFSFESTGTGTLHLKWDDLSWNEWDNPSEQEFVIAYRVDGNILTSIFRIFACPVYPEVENTTQVYNPAGNEINIVSNGTKYLDSSNLKVEYYPVDEQSGKLSSLKPVSTVTKLGKYMYVISVDRSKASADGYEILYRYVPKNTDIPDFGAFDNVGYFTVTKANADITPKVDAVHIYDGNTYDVSGLFTMNSLAGSKSWSLITDSETNGEGTLSGNMLTVTKAGKFKIKLETAETDYCAGAEATAILNVEKGTPSALIYPTASDVTYGDTLEKSLLTGGSGNGTFAWKDSSKCPTVNNSGYEVVFIPNDGDLYAYSEADLTKNVNIKVNPKDITGAQITLGDSLTYSGSEQIQTILGVKVGTLTLTENTDYTISGNTGTEAKNDYVLIITGKGNFKGTATKTFAIAKSNSQTEVSGDESVVYGDTLTLTATVEKSNAKKAGRDEVEFYVGEDEDAKLFGTADVVYVNGNEDGGTATLTVNTTDKKLKIGANTITADYGGSVNLNGSESDVISVELKRKEVELSWSDYENLVYNGQPKDVSVITADFADGDDVRLTADGGAEINAGNYTAAAVLSGTDKDYYKLPNKYTQNYSISPLQIEVGWTLPASLVYDGNEKNVEAEVENVVGNDVVKLTLKEYKKNDAGSYTAEVTAVDNGNYAIGENNSTIRKEWSISQATNSFIQQISIADRTFGESGNDPAATAKFGNPVFTYSDSENGIYGSDAPIDAGTYWVKATVSESNNYKKLESEPISFRILQKDITGADVDAFEELTYTGLEQTPSADVKMDGFNVTGTWSSVTNIDDKTSFTANGNFTGTIFDKETGMKKAIPNRSLTKETTATILRGDILGNATVTEGEILGIDDVVLGGTFAWVDNAKLARTDGTEQMIFTPENKNYDAIIIDVAVSTHSSSGNNSLRRYTVSFETNGGSEVASQNVIKSNKAIEPSKPKKEGYIFDGWYADSEFTTQYNFDKKVTENIIIYAKWVEDEEKHDADVSGKPGSDENELQESKWQNPFTDVKESDWFYNGVKYANENNLMSGTTNVEFSPNLILTRGMLVTILYRLAGEPVVNKSIPFEDVKGNMYYANAVIWAQQNGIISGISETVFAPDENITREQIAVIFYRYAKAMGYDVSVGEDTNILSYADFDEISEYAIESMQYAVGCGLMKGKSEITLNPKDNATRAEIAAILQRFIEGNK